MRVLVVEPEKMPYEKEISEDYKEMQKIVGGLIEAVYPYEDRVALVCNDEGKIDGLPLNRVIEEIQDIIAGTFFVCGLGEESFISLSQEQMDFYNEKFKHPELIMQKEDGTFVAFTLPIYEKQKTANVSEKKEVTSLFKSKPVKSR